MIRNHFKVHKRQETLVTVNCKDATNLDKYLNFMCSNERKDVSFFFHLDISRQKTGLEELLEKFI